MTVANRAAARGWVKWRFVGITSATKWPAGLAASSATGYRRGPLLMASKSTLFGVTGTALKAHRSSIATVWVFGPRSVLSDKTLLAVRSKVD